MSIRIEIPKPTQSGTEYNRSSLPLYLAALRSSAPFRLFELCRRRNGLPCEGGIHFRTDQDAGALLGRAVGKEVYKHNLRPMHDDHWDDNRDDD